MRRRFMTCLLMFCLLWQTMSCAGAAVLMASGNEKVHATLHFEGAAHHHDEQDHADLKLDDSQASAQHLIDDACVHAPALLPVCPLLLSGLSLDVPVALLATEGPRPFLPGLERPPRLNR
jgi:hypothetical protein